MISLEAPFERSKLGEGQVRIGRLPVKLAHTFTAICLTMPSTSVLADVIDDIVAQEMSLVTVCPEGPSVAVVGSSDVEGMLVTSLVQQGSVTVVERDALDALVGEQCHQVNPAFDPSTGGDLNNTVFAKFYVLVEGDLTGSPPFDIDVALVNTSDASVLSDTQLSVSSVEELTAQLDGLAETLSSEISAADYQCNDLYELVVTADVTLQCGGDVPELDTTYSISSNFEMQAVASSVDLSSSGTPQTPETYLTITSGSAETELLMNVTRDFRECTMVMDTTRNIDISFSSEATPADMTLTIPEDGMTPWQISYAYDAPGRLFSGDALMQTRIQSSGTADCGVPDQDRTTPTSYNHFDGAAVSFPPLEVQPNCTPVEVPVYLLTTPKLGVPGTHDTTPSCSVRSATVRAEVQRQF